MSTLRDVRPGDQIRIERRISVANDKIKPIRGVVDDTSSYDGGASLEGLHLKYCYDDQPEFAHLHGSVFTRYVSMAAWEITEIVYGS